jgi:hypothetical protein
MKLLQNFDVLSEIPIFVLYLLKIALNRILIWPQLNYLYQILDSVNCNNKYVYKGHNV